LKHQHRSRVARRGLLTRSVSCARNVQCVVDSSAGQVARAQSVESPVVQLGDIANDNGGGEETDVFEAVLLRTFGADDCCLRDCGKQLVKLKEQGYQARNVTLVNGLVAIDFTSISTRLLVVELAETGSIEMGRNAKNPRGGDGVQRLRYLG
jgi:hypothetical protein